ncbi:redoxin domain-containing protein [Maribellus comscasis]|uniref:thioredoxin-dependent peroxiredoxin n=1 Tax=Maribellus comscasis TaxID=2681766 RepID=A0A6I6JNT2_9BACT|nr:peroxiredoxin family protein [Maribellus comscasis]QGY44595.1 redoxin domain-containing protein [Maribellus comscasis]
MTKLFLFTILLISINTYAQPQAKVSVGDEAISFSLQTIDKEEIHLKNLYQEGPVVLVVLRGWPGYQCPVCTRQVGALVEDDYKFQDLGATVLMIYPGPSEQLQEHAEEFSEDFRFPQNFIFTLDPDYSVINKYGLRWNAPKETAYPSTFVINKSGEIVFAKVSQSHGGRAENEEIFAALEQLN